MSYGNGPTGSATLATPAPKMPVIAEQMNVLESRTETLNQLIAELESRLSPILMSEPPSAKTGPQTQPVASGVPLGASIGQMNERLSLVALRLNGIMERIEV